MCAAVVVVCAQFAKHKNGGHKKFWRQKNPRSPKKLFPPPPSTARDCSNFTPEPHLASTICTRLVKRSGVEWSGRHETKTRMATLGATSAAVAMRTCPAAGGGTGATARRQRPSRGGSVGAIGAMGGSRRGDRREHWTMYLNARAHDPPPTTKKPGSCI